MRGHCWVPWTTSWVRAMQSTPLLLLPRLCLKSQLVDLKAEGYWEELMDEFRPDIVVTDW